MRPTISLAMIVKDETADLERCLASVAEYVDEIVLVTTDPKESHDQAAKLYPGKLHRFPFKWINDFAAARNFSFSKATKDYILWLDADDVLAGGEKLQDAIAHMQNAGLQWLAFNYRYAEDSAGIGIANHMKPRLLRNDGKSIWKKPVHENLEYQGHYEWDKFEAIEVVHHITTDQMVTKQHRNLAILQAEYDRDGENTDPRTLHYLGNSYLGLGLMGSRNDEPDWRNLLEAAVFFYDQHAKKSGWPEETYFSYLGIGQAFGQMDRYGESVSAFLKAVDTRPDWSDAYWYLCILYADREVHGKAVQYGEIALAKRQPNTILAVNESLHKFIGPSFLAQAYLMTNQTEKALRLSRAIWDGSDRSNQLLTLAIQANELESFVQSARVLVEKTLELDPKSVTRVVDNLPTLLMQDVRIQEMRYQYASPKDWASDEITFFCGRTHEEWADPSVLTGIGGSEEATIYLAREFAARGWKVTVFNNCGDMAGTYNGVTYRSYLEFNPNDHFNLLILWRTPQQALAVNNAKKLWVILHDRPMDDWFNDEIIRRIDKFVFLSEYQRSCAPQVPDEKVMVSGNALDLEGIGQVFKSAKRNPHKIIWSSSYDRGLKYLLERWPEIRKAVPDATLEPLYGWETFDALRGNDPAAQAFKAEMQALLDQPGIGKARRVGKDELAKEFAESGLWVYPTDFWEISCITAMRAQALGAVPVCTDFAALKETVQHGIKVQGVRDLGGMTPKVMNLIVAATIELLKDPAKQEKFRKPMMAWAQKEFTWETIAYQWITAWDAA